MSDSNNPYLITVGEPWTRNRGLDRAVVEDVVAVWMKQAEADSALAQSYLRAVTVGDWGKVEELSVEVRKMIARQKGEPFIESHLPDPLVPTPDRPSEMEEDDFTLHQRLHIKQGATTEQLLAEVLNGLQTLQKHTSSYAQRLGVESAIRLIERGVRIEP